MHAASLNGSLAIIQHPFEDDEFADNRTGIELGSSVSLSCVANYSGEEDHILPVEILWTRDGETVISHASCGDGNAETGIGDSESVHCISESMNNNQLNSSLHIRVQQIGGAGVYQCIFILNTTDTEFITTRPIKIDTGTCFTIVKLCLLLTSGCRPSSR